jgi:hypothetical protein
LLLALGETHSGGTTQLLQFLAGPLHIFNSDLLKHLEVLVICDYTHIINTEALTGFFVVAAKVAQIRAASLNVHTDGLLCFAEALRVHPLLAGAFTLKHFFAGVVGRAADAVAFGLFIEFGWGVGLLLPE